MSHSEGDKKCPIKHALLIATMHIRNIALQKTIWSVLAVRQLEKVVDRNCIIFHAFDTKAFEFFRIGRLERIDDDPI